MADTAAHLRAQVFPEVPVRQWVCTMPKRLRFLLVWKPKWISLALTLFLRALFAWQRRCARKQGIKDPICGAVNESVEGLLVQVSGRITRLSADVPYGHKVFIADGSGELQVFVHIVAGKPVADVASLAVGNKIRVTGLTGQYNTSYEVIPRMAKDLVKVP